MKKLFIYVFLNILCLNTGAYDRIEFQQYITNPAFMVPSGVAVSRDRVFISDSKANAVFIFDNSGKFLKKVEAVLNAPGSMSFGNGRLYIADSGNSRIVVTDEEGKFLWAFAQKGSLPGQLKNPMAVVFGHDGKIYAADTGNYRVQVYNEDGIFLYGFDTKKTDGITKISPIKINVDLSGSIYVSDASAIQKLSGRGAVLKEFPHQNDGFAVDDYGFIYLLNSKEGKVKEISSKGETLGAFGTRGKGKTEFGDLKDAAADFNGNVYLVDAKNKKIVSVMLESKLKSKKLEKIAVFDRFGLKGPVKSYGFKADVFEIMPDFSLLAHLSEVRELVFVNESGKTTVSSYGQLDGQVKQPMGLSADYEGKIFVSDTGNGRIQILDANGKFSGSFGEKAGLFGGGMKEGKFTEPAGIAVNKNGRIYVTDAKAKRIQAFNLDGIFLFAVGPQIDGALMESPRDIEVDEDDNAYILDSRLRKVIVTDASGKLLKTWDASEHLAGPAAIKYDKKGYFYILDQAAFNIKVFDKAGKLITSFFAKGTGDRELNDPRYIDVKENKLYVSDAGQSKILVYEIEYTPVEPYELSAATVPAGVNLAWKSADELSVKEYRLFRSSTSLKGFEPIGSVKEQSYADKSLKPDATYYYKVSAVSLAGKQGPASKEVYAYLPAEEQAQSAQASEELSGNISMVEIEPVELGYIFSANYKHYLNNPVGIVAVKNNTDNAFKNLKLSFYLRDFMDFSCDTIVEEIGPRQKVEIALKATLNNKILGVTEDTPVQAQFSVTYYENGQEKTFTINKPLKVLSKNAIVWDKPARIANFITPKDTPVFSFSRFAMQAKSKLEQKARLLNENLVTAVFLWDGLSEYGISYLQDPVNPYSVIKSSKEAVLDTVQFPRNTLNLKSGDCDDLTALVSSLFEASGLRSAVLDYLAHIAIMFDTGLSDAKEVGLPEEHLIKYNNTLWIGVETTMLGKDFYESIKHAAGMYKNAGEDVKIIETKNAWAEFEPVTLPETEFGIRPDEGKTAARVEKTLETFRNARYEYLKSQFESILRYKPEDFEANINLGILQAQYNKTAEARKNFETILKDDPFNASALNNLGNANFLDKKYDEAKEYYFKASKADPYDAEIWLNLARASVKSGKTDEAKDFVEKAVKLDPSLKVIGDKLIK